MSKFVILSQDEMLRTKKSTRTNITLIVSDANCTIRIDNLFSLTKSLSNSCVCNKIFFSNYTSKPIIISLIIIILTIWNGINYCCLSIMLSLFFRSSSSSSYHPSILRTYGTSFSRLCRTVFAVLLSSVLVKSSSMFNFSIGFGFVFVGCVCSFFNYIAYSIPTSF